jgi:hypothetical protein
LNLSENKNTNVNYNSSDEIDLYDIVRFFVVNKKAILLSMLIGFTLGLGYVVYKIYKPSKEATAIAVNLTGVALSPSYGSLNIEYINKLYDFQNKELDKKENPVFNVKHYFSENLNPKENSEPFLNVQSLEFGTSPSGYSILVKSPQENIDIARIITALNYASNEYNKSLLVAMGENASIVSNNAYDDRKTQLSANLFSTQLKLKKMLLPLQSLFEEVEDEKFAKMFKGANLDGNLMLLKQAVEKQQDYLKIDNFKNLIAELEIYKKITSEQANMYSNNYLNLQKSIQDQEAQIKNFPFDKLLPTFEKSSISSAEFKMRQSETTGSKNILVVIAAVILGTILGVVVVALNIFVKEYKKRSL